MKIHNHTKKCYFCISLLLAIVVQEVEGSFSNRKFASSNPTPPHQVSSVLEQDTEPPTTPDVRFGNLDRSL